MFLNLNHFIKGIYYLKDQLLFIKLLIAEKPYICKLLNEYKLLTLSVNCKL